MSDLDKQLPEGHYFSIEDIFGAPVLVVRRKRRWLWDENVMSTWIEVAPWVTDDEAIEQAKEALLASMEERLRMARIVARGRQQ